MSIRLAMGSGALALALVATPAMADITITDANVAGNPAQNVLLGGNETGLSVIGITSDTSTPILFTGEETLTEPAAGQARIEANVGTFTDLVITLLNPGLFFTKLEFNLNAAADGDVTITALDNFNVAFTQTLTLDANG
jgi:hypothetical protein